MPSWWIEMSPECCVRVLIRTPADAASGNPHGVGVAHPFGGDPCAPPGLGLLPRSAPTVGTTFARGLGDPVTAPLGTALSVKLM
jgi:hypothetical protein